MEWSPAAERALLGRMDIGLMPLPDTMWARYKCAYKALQYMASGIPVIADDVGITANVVDGAGVVVRRDVGWREALLGLADDPALRERLGRSARERVRADFSLERWVPDLARILLHA
jgi:glycosyltransferase involved in cell wall biosynthesis